jgi:perosamine synthetase
MSWRRQLPAYSPLPAGAVLAGAAGILWGADPARAAIAAVFARSYGSDEALLTDSGTGALTLAIRASLAGSPGAPVALPAYGCYDLATAADGVGCPVLLYDLDPGTLAPDLASLHSVLERGARAVVLAHWYGVPADPEPVLAAVRSAGAILIEDAAQGAGGSWRRRPLGSFGDLTVLSFGRGKGNTAGRGGALLAHGALGVAAFARARGAVVRARRGVKELLQLKAQWLLGRPSLYAVPSALPFLRLGETVYHPPTSVRAISAVAARTLAVTLPLGEREAEIRRANAGRLLARGRAGLVPPRVPGGGVAGYLRLPLVAAPGARAAALSVEARGLGIMPGYPLALCDLPGFAERLEKQADRFEGARAMAERLVTLPTHSLLKEGDLLRLESWLARAGN